MLHSKVFVDVSDALFVHHGVTSTIWLLLNCCFPGGSFGTFAKLVSGFLTCEFFYASCGLRGTSEAQVPACCLGPQCCERHGRIGKAVLRGLYVTGYAVAFVASRAARGTLDEGARGESVEPFDNSKYAVQVESVVSGIGGEEKIGRSWEGEGMGDRGTCGGAVGGQ